MKILFLSRWLPYPTNNGSKLRIYNLLRGLAKHHDVTLLSFSDQPNLSLDLPELHSLCTKVQVVPWREFDQDSWRARIGFLSSTPRFLLDTHSDQMESLIRNAVSLKKYDLVIASQLSMASYYKCFVGLPALFEELELGPFYHQDSFVNDFFRRIHLNLTWLKLKNYLMFILGYFNLCTVVSRNEDQLFTANFKKHKGKINVIPNCINYDDYQELAVQPVPAQLIFTGSFRFNANYEAMKWFVQDVFPKVLEQLPETQLVITGDHAGLPLPSVPNVTLAGYVDDIKSLVASSRVSIAPLLVGGGTRLKILESMAIGTPVVATSKGAEGLDAISGEHLLTADSPNEFADHVVALLKDNGLREKLSVNGKLFVKQSYNWESVMPRFLNLVERVGRG